MYNLLDTVKNQLGIGMSLWDLHLMTYKLAFQLGIELILLDNL